MGGPMLHAQIALPAAAPLINTARTLSPPSEASGRTAEAPQQSQQEGWLALGRPRT
jgi:hypothetical protein